MCLVHPERVAAASREVGLIVAGTIWDKAEGEALNNPRVTFVGPKKGAELAGLCRAAIAVVVPNIDIGIGGFEGFGLSATEAAAAGGVVLAARVDGLEDAVMDEATGFLLPPSDADRWASKIDEVRGWSEEQREAFVKHSRAMVVGHYSWTRVAEATIAAYAQEA